MLYVDISIAMLVLVGTAFCYVCVGTVYVYVYVWLYVQGTLSFLSAPLLGALSDAWGRKSFLLLAVFITCAPIPLLLLNAM